MGDLAAPLMQLAPALVFLLVFLVGPVAVFFAFDFLGRLVVGHWHEATRRGS